MPITRRVTLLPYAIGAVLVAALVGCAKPHVVDEFKISDYELDCDSLNREILKAETHKDAAGKASYDLTTQTVVSAILLPPMWLLVPPALMMESANDSHISDAKEAAIARLAHLREIYQEKDCPT